VILSKLGDHYHGVDIAPSAVEKTQKAIEEFVEMDVNEHCPYSASIFVRKP